MYPSAVAEATAAASARATSKADTEPPPTRVFRADAMADRPFAPPKVLPVPEIPEPGLLPAAKYAVGFARARWQRRKAIKVLGAEVKQDTIALDQVLGALGAAARIANVEGRVFNTENAAITAAEQRRSELQGEQQGLDGRTAEESAKFADIETERTTKLNEAEKVLDGAKRDNETFEAQRRGLRDKRKEIERRQKAYLKAAEDRDNESANTSMGEVRSQMRRAAEGHRREAAELEPERQDLDRKLSAIEKPLLESQARLDAAKAEYDSAKRSLNDAREGHGHRLAELDAEKKRKLRDISAADNEISRRLVTLGTLVNLNRVEDPSFVELYERIDRLKGAITARTTEAEKLTAERSAYHRESLIRGAVVIGGAIVAFIALIVILRAIF
jgi:chromosome segregation ATPase